MKSLFVMGLLMVSIQLHAQSDASRELKKLDWLLGKWERTNNKQGTTAYEKWELSPDKTFVGEGVTMKGDQVAFREALKIEAKEGQLYYVAHVSSNGSPTYFKITTMTEKGFVSENPDHDFPKMISYELKGNILTAVISDGGDKKMGFVFKKITR